MGVMTGCNVLSVRFSGLVGMAKRVGMGISPSVGGDCPVSVGLAGDSEYADASDVDRGGDLGVSVDPGAASAGAGAHQVPDLAFHFGSGGPVFGLLGRILPRGSSPGQLGFVGPILILRPFRELVHWVAGGQPSRRHWEWLPASSAPWARPLGRADAA